jgi:hypothetical protein
LFTLPQTTGHHWLEEKIARMFDGFETPSAGRVVSWVPANPENGDQALWHVRHNDGDEEDLDEVEMKAALRLHGKMARKQKADQLRARQQQRQLEIIAQQRKLQQQQQQQQHGKKRKAK